jgi:hypothetical protein
MKESGRKLTSDTTMSVLISIASLLMLSMVADARIFGVYTNRQWESNHATFYGGNDTSGTIGILYILYD